MMFEKVRRDRKRIPSVRARLVGQLLTSFTLLTPHAMAAPPTEAPPPDAPQQEEQSGWTEAPSGDPSKAPRPGETPAQSDAPQESDAPETSDAPQDGKATEKSKASNESEAPASSEPPGSPSPNTSAVPAKQKAAVEPGGPTSTGSVVEPGQDAQREAPSPMVDAESLPFTYHQLRFDLGAGPRLSWSFDSTFDLFSKRDAFASLAVRAGGTVWSRERVSVAVVGEWEQGGTQGEVRGVETRLDLNRWLLGVEGRYHVLSRLAGYARFAAGVSHLSSRIGPESNVTTLEHSSAAFSASLAVGAAVRVFGASDGRLRSPRAHLYAEGGYVQGGGHHLIYEPIEGGPIRAQPVDLGTFSASGPQVTAGVLLTL